QAIAMKTTLTVFLTLACTWTLSLPLAGQSLAKVAKQEEERRKDIKKPAKVLTNKDLGSVPPPSAVAPTKPSPAEGQPATATEESGNESGSKVEPKAQRAVKAGAPPAAPEAKGQAYWSGRQKEIATALSRD